MMALLLLLGACADGPETDSPARLMVPPSYSAYLPSGAITPYSQLVAAAMREQDLPATADYATRRDWALRMSITQSGGMATPTYVLVDPAGTERATVRTRPVPIDTWKRARPETMREAAAEAAPRIAPVFKRLEAERREAAAQRLSEQQAAERKRLALAANPTNRPMRVAIVGIVGAPTDGGRVLRQLMKDKLTKLGEVVQEAEAQADFTVRAKVDDVPIDAKTHRLEIFWLVRNARNEEVGEIVQLEEIAAGSLDRGWGPLANSVTEEAAGAIHDVIRTQLGLR